jgi:hypothetical protein
MFERARAASIRRYTQAIGCVPPKLEGVVKRI